jgi:tetratricopeptide (TPR) repeat protein
VKKPALLQTIVRNVLILSILLVLMLTPRPLTGYMDLASARQLDASNDFGEAASAYTLAAQRISWMPSLWEKAGEAYLNDKDFYRAESSYEAAFQMHSLSPSGYMGWGDTAFSLGNPKVAVKLWNELLNKGGNPASLLPRIAHGDQALGLYFDEIQAWQKYLAIQPGVSAAHFRLGLLLAATSPGEALPELMQAVQLDSTLDESVQSLRTALNIAFLSNDRAYEFLVSGRALGSLGDWDLAAEAFRNAIAVRKDYAEAWAWLGEAKQQLGQVGSVEIERAMAFNPDSSMVESLYGLYLQRQNQPKQALAAIQKAAALEPENPGWQMALGEGYEQTGDLVAALEHFQHATELSPNDAAFWQALAEFCLRNNVDLAGTGLAAARKLVELTNNNWQSDDIAGQVLMETDDLVGAEGLLKKAIELNPTQAAPSLHLGLLYMQTGDRGGAYSYLNQAKAFDPGGQIGWQAARLLEEYFP